MFINQYVSFIGEEREIRYPEFVEEYKVAVRRENYRKGTNDIREEFVRNWECWAVMNNLHMVHGIKPEHKVLEYGAHPLFHCVYIQKKFGCEIWAIDNFQVRERIRNGEDVFRRNYFPEEWLWELSEYNLDRLHAEEGDIQHTRFSDKFFDSIISLGVHEHVADDIQGLKEAHRILKDDGYLSMTVDYQYYGLPYNKIVQGRIYDRNSLQAIIDQSGFEHVWEPNWAITEPWKEIKSTWEDPHVFVASVLLKKKGAK